MMIKSLLLGKNKRRAAKSTVINKYKILLNDFFFLFGLKTKRHGLKEYYEEIFLSGSELIIVAASQPPKVCLDDKFWYYFMWS